MLKIWKFFLFFLLCLVIGLLLNLPVQQVMPYVKLPDTIKLYGIDGTLLKGKAAELSIDRFPVRDIRYRYLPSCLPLLKVCYKIEYERGEIRAAYDVLNGDTEISHTLIDYQVGELMAYLPNPLVRLVGNLELSIDELSYYEGKPAVLTGKLVSRGLGIDDQGIRLYIGDVQLDFNGNAQGYKFKISDLDASLDISGNGEIKPGGEYQVDVRISAETGIDPQVKSVLGMVARSDGHNRYRLQQTGRLPPNIVRQLF